MDKCTKNKDDLLTLFFHEGSRRKEREIQAHVDSCKECRDYLFSLGQMEQTLQQWQDEAPQPGIFDLILSEIPVKQTAPARAPVRPALSLSPLLPIVFSILAIFTVIFFFHDKLTLLPIWETLKECWCVKYFGSLGATAFLVFLSGLLITLSVSPILILEAKSKKYRYYFN